LAQTVDGRVVDAATGSGVGGAKVELLRGGAPVYETITDPGGRFRIDNVGEGDYAARYHSPDYWLTAGTLDYHPFHLAAGSSVNLVGRLMPWSRISGRVVDAQGDGVANAPLQLTGAGMMVNGRTFLRTSWGGGGGGQFSDGPLAMTFMGKTDAQGQFEVQLMPGSYGLSVVPPPGLKPPDPGQDGAVLAWKQTYYPSADVADAASKIVVLPGGEVSGIELKLLAVPAHAVRGVVLYPDGTPAPKVAIAFGERPRSAPVVSQPDGTFEFPAVPEGEWRFSAEAQKGSVKLRATEWIEVTKHDVENVKLRLATPLMIRGRVVMQGSKDQPAAVPEPLILSLRGGRTRREDDLGLDGAALAEPDAAGEFTAQAYPGVYGLGRLFSQARPSYYLDAVRAGEANLAVQDVEISSDVAITVVYRSDGGSVGGKAENCASGGVVLVPSTTAL
jgi:Carboxypeptidase regulatory-like domain